MLGKILKHDMRSMSKMAIPMFVSSGVISVICCTLLYFTYGYSDGADSMLGAIFVTSGFYLVGVFAIVAMWCAVAFLAFTRYYKSLFTDEGYLNMVLPVKTVTLFSGKLVSVYIWIIMASVVAAASLAITFVLPTVLYDSQYFTSFIDTIELILGIGYEEVGAMDIAIGLCSTALSVLTFLEGVLVVITAITLGASIMKKRKVLGSIVFYFAITFVQQSGEDIASGIFDSIFESSPDLSALIVTVLSILATFAISAGMYFLSLYTLNTRFNIE